MLDGFTRRWRAISAAFSPSSSLLLYTITCSYYSPSIKHFNDNSTPPGLGPIDLIPDFIPVLGYLDDLIIIPLGVSFLIKMIPGEILEECRERARFQSLSKKPKNWVEGIIIVLIWVLVGYLTLRIVW